MDLDKLIETLKAGGASQTEIDAVVSTYSEAKYQPKTVAMQPAFYLESDKTVLLGRDSQTLRLMNVDDLRRVLPKLIEFVRHLLAESGSDQTAEQMLSSASPMGLLGVVIQKVMQLNIQGDYPVWYVALLEEVATLASNDERKVTAQDIISLPPSQMADLIKKIIEVNQQDFLALWASVPPGIRLTISTLVSRLTSAGKKLSQGILALENSTGGQESSGKSVSVSPSAKKPASPKPKSGAAPSLASSSSGTRLASTAASRAS